MEILVWWRRPSSYMRSSLFALAKRGHQVSVYSDSQAESWSWPTSVGDGAIHTLAEPLPAGVAPELLIASMFGVPRYQALAAQLAWKLPSCKRVGASDAPRKGSLRQAVAISLRAAVRRVFPTVFVPGLVQMELMKAFGYRDEQIDLGLYCADSSIFSPDHVFVEPVPPMAPFLFVGQLVERKGLARLLEGYSRYRTIVRNPRPLVVVGEANPASPVVAGEGVRPAGRLSPAKVAGLMRTARALVHPATEEHWGVVVQEAARVGLPAIVSSSVGARELLTPHEPTTLTEADSATAVTDALLEVEAMPAYDYLALRRTLADSQSACTSEAWAATVEQIGRRG